MKRLILIFFILTGITFLYNESFAKVTVKIREIAAIDGLKENQVFGFGLVVGLQGTGDTKSALVQSSLKSLLKSVGIIEEDNLKSKNIAAVLLTAKLQPFANIGDRVDITVSSIGDAKSLEGGILVQSPLMAADGQIYVVSQGSLSFPSDKRGGRKIKTVATVVNGGIVEREVEPEIIANNAITLILKNWDYTVANNIIKAISDQYKDSKPEILNNGKIKITIPKDINIAEFISTIELIEVSPSSEATIVINERDGTIVMGGDVKISEVVVSKDGMTVKVDSKGEKTNTGTSNTALLKEASTVKDIVDSLNYIGVSTHDIIAILKAIKDAGALHANLIIK